MSYTQLQIEPPHAGQWFSHLSNPVIGHSSTLCDRPLETQVVIQVKTGQIICLECLKKAVELVFSLEIEADTARDKSDDSGAWSDSHWASQIQDDLEAIGITLEQNEKDEEVYHIRWNGQPWYIFHLVEWAWREADGKWEWEKERDSIQELYEHFREKIQTLCSLVTEEDMYSWDELSPERRLAFERIAPIIKEILEAELSPEIEGEIKALIVQEKMELVTKSLSEVFNWVSLRKITRIEVTGEHIELLKRLQVTWDDGDGIGTPGIDWKRPYGNSDVLGDINDICLLGYWDVEQEDWQPGAEAKLVKLHHEVATALEILVQCCGISPGIYTRESPFKPWQKEESPLLKLAYEHFHANKEEE